MRWYFVLGTALFFTACDNNPVGPSDLIGKAWSLQSLQEAGSDPVTVPDPSRYTVSFEDEGRIAVKSDCNSCGGTYTLSGSTLQVEPLACTKVFCGDDSLDPRFPLALEGTRSVTVDSDAMTIEGGGVTLKLMN